MREGGGDPLGPSSGLRLAICDRTNNNGTRVCSKGGKSGFGEGKGEDLPQVGHSSRFRVRRRDMMQPWIDCLHSFVSSSSSGLGSLFRGRAWWRGQWPLLRWITTVQEWAGSDHIR